MEEKIKKFLSDYRKKFNKTQKEMASLIGVSYVTYQEMEKGIIKKVDGLNKLKIATGFNQDEDVHGKIGTEITSNENEKNINSIDPKESNNNNGNDSLDPLSIAPTPNSYKQKMEDAIYNLTVSNSNLAIAFVKQATAHEKQATAYEKDAEARIIQASANKILVEVNRDTLAKIPDSPTEKELRIQDSLQLSQTLDQLASVTDLPMEDMDSFEGRRKFFHRLYALSQNSNKSSDRFFHEDSQNK